MCVALHSFWDWFSPSHLVPHISTCSIIQARSVYKRLHYKPSILDNASRVNKTELYKLCQCMRKSEDIAYFSHKSLVGVPNSDL